LLNGVDEIVGVLEYLVSIAKQVVFAEDLCRANVAVPYRYSAQDVS
jgi:hypothetical protein